MRFFAVLGLLSLVACGGSGGEALGTDEIETRGIDDGRPGDDVLGGGDDESRSEAPAIGPSCRSDDPALVCLALRYVVYRDADGNAVSSDDAALENLRGMNTIWSSCGIRFQIDELLYADPREKGLLFNPASHTQLGAIRAAYASKNALLLVTTGLWSGALGAGSPNAWATLPGTSPSGVVLESAVHDYSNLYAHEIGHSLNLDHAGSFSNVMSAVIYTSSVGLTATQCASARDAIARWLARMMR